MIYLKKSISALLCITAFTATMQVGNTFKIAQVQKEVEAFEPVIIERVEYVEVTPEPTSEPEVIPEPEVPEVVPEPIPEPVVVQPRIDCPLDDETQQMVLEKSEEYNVDFAFTMAVIFRESSFRPDVVSYDGSSVGLMQIHKINHEWLSEKLGITDFFDPEQNVTAGLYMLHDLFEKYDDPAKVLMAYNMGETGARRLWDQGIYTSDYAEDILQLADKYNEEIQERMGEK